MSMESKLLDSRIKTRSVKNSEKTVKKTKAFFTKIHLV